MKIISLEASNVKRLRAVTIRPDPTDPLVLITGSNGQGKTSVLDSIAYAFGGKDVQPPKVIREGEEKAQVIVDLGELTVIRRWTSNEKSYLEVRSKDGAKFGSPQAMLDKLVGSLSFDPLSFTRLEPKKQAEALRKLVGLDFGELEAKRARLYEDRTHVNREASQAKARLEAMPDTPAPAESPSLEDLLAEQEMLLEVQRDNDKARAALKAAQGDVALQYDRVANARAAIEELERRLLAAKTTLRGEEQKLVETEKRRDEAAQAATELVDPDLASVRERIRNAQATTEAVRRRKERERLAAEFKQLQVDSEGCTKQIAELDAEKERLLSAAKFPVDGLSFGEAGVTFQGLPLEQASAAEQLRVSVGMGLALNPKVKVLLIRDGSLLDQRSLRLVAEMAEAAGAQCWVERVAAPGEMGVLIEDGEVNSSGTERTENA